MKIQKRQKRITPEQLLAEIKSTAVTDIRGPEGRATIINGARLAEWLRDELGTYEAHRERREARRV